MANTNVTHGEAKSICDKLECSPSQHDSHGNFGGKPSISPTAKNSESVTKNTRGDHTSEFHQKVSSGRDSKAGYKGRYAKGARQE